MAARQPLKRRGKAYSQRSAKSQCRIDSQIRQQYGAAKSDRERALRDLREGTWHPFARTKARRIPERKLREQPPIITGGGQSIEELREAAIRGWRHAHEVWADSDTRAWLEYTDANVLDAIENHASVAALRLMAAATPDELQDWARAQNKRQAGKLHPGLAPSDLGWMTPKGTWINIMWYHSGSHE